MQTFTGKEQSDIISMKKLIALHYKNAIIKLPSELANFINKHGIITGGISASVQQGKIPNDIDVYLKSKSAVDAFNSAIETETTVIMDCVKNVNPEYGLETKMKGKLVTARAVTFECGIQVITMSDMNVREKFDFIHCMPWYDIDADKYYISRSQYDSIVRRVIVPNPTPGATAITRHRLTKYIERGWTYNAEELDDVVWRM